MPASASRYLRPCSSHSQTPSPRTKATCCRAYVFITCDADCDMRPPKCKTAAPAAVRKILTENDSGKALQAFFFGRLEDPDAWQVALVHDAVHLHAPRRAQQVAQVLGDLRGDQLAGHQHRDAGRVGHDLVCADAPGEAA